MHLLGSCCRKPVGPSALQRETPAGLAGIISSEFRRKLMRKIYEILAVTILGASLIGPTSFAQDHHDAYVQHDEWKKGSHMKSEDWNRAQPIDYHQYHLKAPPKGYEWRSVDGHYVLANNSGVISTVVVVKH
jgi:Ni/Co efflux regulator RcnB